MKRKRRKRHAWCLSQLFVQACIRIDICYGSSFHRATACIRMEHRFILNGKYRDRLFAEVEHTDMDYCAWVLRSPPNSLPPSLRLFQCYLRRKHGGVIRVGKHKGCYFNELFSNEPAYATWVLGLDNPAGSLLEFKNYVVAASTATAPRSRTRSPRRTNGYVERVQAGDKHRVDVPSSCRVCYDLPVRTAFTGCGHMVCCTRCAFEFMDKQIPCPICRTPVQDVIRLFGC